MLRQAGVPHDVHPAGIDELETKRRSSDPEVIAAELAQAKALAISATYPNQWVIGSDSVVTVEGVRFGKPATREQAEDHLRRFSGKSMRLASAVALAQGAAIDWSHRETALLEVRPLSSNFIHAYLEAEWPDVGSCAGVFRLEGPGVQLFDRIEGEYFSILGMPLLPLLGALRQRRLLPA